MSPAVLMRPTGLGWFAYATWPGRPAAMPCGPRPVVYVAVPAGFAVVVARTAPPAKSAHHRRPSLPRAMSRPPEPATATSWIFVPLGATSTRPSLESTTHRLPSLSRAIPCAVLIVAMGKFWPVFVAGFHAATPPL